VIKRATPDHPVHEVIAKRWSPYAFADREVSDEDLFSLFEAPPLAPDGTYHNAPYSDIERKRSLDALSPMSSNIISHQGKTLDLVA